MSIIDPQALVITVRESLEAFLLLSIFAGLVVKLGRPEAKRYLMWGALAAVVFSLIAGYVTLQLIQVYISSGDAAEIFAGVTSLVAVAILTYMIVWMYRHTIMLVTHMHQETKRALALGGGGVLFSIAFVAVAREGLETVVFFAALAPTTSSTSLGVSLLLGIAISAIISWLLFSGIARLSISKFMATTGFLLIFFAGGLLIYGIHEMTSFGPIPDTPVIWNTEWLLDQHGDIGGFVKAVTGYREAPTMLEAGSYVAYVGGMSWWYLRGVLKTKGSGEPDGDANSVEIGTEPIKG